MNPHSGINDNNKSDRTKAIAAAIPMAGMLVAAALLSGLSMIGNNQPAIAQNVTAGGNATTTSPTTAGAGNTTGTACAPQTGGGNATTTAGGGNATTTAGEAAEGEAEDGTTTLGTKIVGGNATTAGGNQTTGSPTQLIQQACLAAQNNDTQGVLMNLNAALNALSANATTAEGAEGGEEEGEGAEGGEGGEEEGEGEEAEG
ncbi:MAG: hypothetical protein M3263_00445 [Thermoproteota archaeon]|nr:hypothetical protein [Thermoproteota archaeon]